MFLVLLILSESCVASVRNIGKISPGFEGSQMNWIDNDGLFLLSNSSSFAFGFITTPKDVTWFLLSIIHMSSLKVVWCANRASPVRNSDDFVFDDSGNAYLQSGTTTVWSSDTAGKGVSAMELLDSGNLVLRGNDSSIIWQSFSHPTDTLLSNQDFTEGMRLESNPSSNLNSNNLTYFLEIKSGDMILFAGFQTPQPYWSMSKETRKTIDRDGGVVALASLNANSWRFYDKNKVLLWQFIFSENTDTNATWVAVLKDDGSITFSSLQNRGSSVDSQTEIPNDQCSTPEPCGPYSICSNSINQCKCPPVLAINPTCEPGIVSPCDRSGGPLELVKAGDGLNYFALGFVSPVSKTDLEGCKASCTSNCSCLALFFDNSSGNCFQFDRIGSFQTSNNGGGFVSYIKVLSTGGGGNTAGGGGSSQKHFPYVVIIAIGTVLVIAGLLFAGYRYYRRKRTLPESPKDTSEEDNFLESLSGMPIRRKSYDPNETSEKSHYPSYAFKMMEEGKLRSILDSKLEIDERDERVAIAVKVALWCIQDDMHLRPPMTKVVQMLEGLSAVPTPPTASQVGSRLYSSFLKSTSDEGTSSGPSDCNSDAYLSAVRLSGPR
ncbi:hypothetical protein Acr_20g0001630 [Actinidia rufa]|uniref:Uncharacterized protein n=1 Tax=Actinidia rufa TaxID=165716 RepID=A0A7J0GC15_9ERIC|nr:hypothetical protein Acr_20g0001630 [Actinidia rufa]